MDNKIVIIGLGEIGSVFARGFLKLGYPVYPVTRSMTIQSAAEQVPNPKLVVIAVGENDLQNVIRNLPSAWANSAVLLQNELLPQHWAGSLPNPTVISVWFEKKKGQDSKVVISSPVYGPNAPLIKNALASLDIATRVVDWPEQLLYELVRKNVYILTTNIAGLIVGGNVRDLWQHHRALTEKVAADVLSIQCALVQQDLALDNYLDGMLEAFEGDPDHKCMGRTAPQRLDRALGLAKQLNLDVPTLTYVKQQISSK